MVDLLYLGSNYEEEKKLIQDKFPNAILKEEYDDIHEYRLSVEINDEEKREYLKFIIQQGLGSISFWIQMSLNQPSYIKGDQTNYLLLKEIIAEIKS